MQSLVLSIYCLTYYKLPVRLLGFAILVTSCFYFYIGNYYNYFGATPYFLLICYLFIGLIISTVTSNQCTNWKYILIGIVLLCINTFTLYEHYENTLVLYILKMPIGGAGLLIFAVGLPKISLPKYLEELGSATYGIFLSHVIFLEAFEFIVEKLYPNEIHYDFFAKILVTTMIFIIASFFTFSIRKVANAKLFLLGEKN